MNERYDIRGNAYRVKTTLEDGTVLGCPLYEDSGTGEEMEGDLQVIDVQLFDEPPRQKVEANLADLTAKVSAARAELSRLTQDVREAEKDGKARLAKLAQYDQLKRLEDFLDGKITHYVLVDWYPPKVISLVDATCESGDRDLRLLCLYGTPKRTLEWKLNRYSDGSGGSRTFSRAAELKRPRKSWPKSLPITSPASRWMDQPRPGHAATGLMPPIRSASRSQTTTAPLLSRRKRNNGTRKSRAWKPSWRRCES